MNCGEGEIVNDLNEIGFITFYAFSFPLGIGGTKERTPRPIMRGLGKGLVTPVGLGFSFDVAEQE